MVLFETPYAYYYIARCRRRLRQSGFFGVFMCVCLYSGCTRRMTAMLLNELFTKYYEVFLNFYLKYPLYSEKRKRWRAHWISCPYSAHRYDVAYRYQCSYCVLNGINRNAKHGIGQDPIPFYDFSFKYNIRRWRILLYIYIYIYRERERERITTVLPESM